MTLKKVKVWKLMREPTSDRPEANFNRSDPAEEKDVRILSIVAIGELQVPTMREPLIELAESASNELEIRQVAILGLSTIADAEGVRRLEKLFKQVDREDGAGELQIIIRFLAGELGIP